MRWRVFMPLGQTMVHLPHNMQWLNNLDASSLSPFWRERIALLRLVSSNAAAVQLAEQLPQAMHLRTSGSEVASWRNFSLSALSRLILELGFTPKPKSIIS